MRRRLVASTLCATLCVAHNVLARSTVTVQIDVPKDTGALKAMRNS